MLLLPSVLGIAICHTSAGYGPHTQSHSELVFFPDQRIICEMPAAPERAYEDKMSISAAPNAMGPAQVCMVSGETMFVKHTVDILSIFAQGTHISGGVEPPAIGASVSQEPFFFAEALVPRTEIPPRAS